MTLPAGLTPEDAGQREGGAAGRALEASPCGLEADPALAPFFAAGRENGDETSAKRRSLYARALDYSAHAAMIAGLLGFAWTVSDHVVKPSVPPAPKPTPTTAVVDETTELRRSNQKMAADLGALRASLETLRASLHQDKTADQLRQLAAGLDGVKSGLAAAKSETSVTLAQVTSRIDHMPHPDVAPRLQQLAERLDRMEHQDADRTVTASLPPAPAKSSPVAVPPVKPQAAARTPEPVADPARKSAPAEADAAKKPAVLVDWVVRDVYDGVAVVESKRGPMEVVPGVAIPGAGTVKSIDRHGSGWTVTTSKGLIAYMPLPRAREQHGYYRTMPEDF